MGVFDTVHFPRPIACVACQAPITSTQTKAFDPFQNQYQVGECIDHAEVIRIVREELFCESCRSFNEQWVYLVVYRGVLVDVATDLEAAEKQLHGFSFERLLLWYHDLYARFVGERRERRGAEHFLRDVVSWFGEGYHQMPAEEREKRWILFFMNRHFLREAGDPLDAIRAYLKRDEEQEAD